MDAVFVDLTYRGLELGRRVKLHEVGPTTAYLEHGTPMPVGSQVVIATDEGLSIPVEVVRVHEQVAGAEMPPGMRVRAGALDGEAAAWWQRLVSREDPAIPEPPGEVVRAEPRAVKAEDPKGEAAEAEAAKAEAAKAEAAKDEAKASAAAEAEADAGPTDPSATAPTDEAARGEAARGEAAAGEPAAPADQAAPSDRAAPADQAAPSDDAAAAPPAAPPEPPGSEEEAPGKPARRTIVMTAAEIREAIGRDPIGGDGEPAPNQSSQGKNGESGGARGKGGRRRRRRRS